jgi:PAS domain S-box-containing protein
MQTLSFDLAAVLDTAIEAFVALDADGGVIAWNPAAEELFGWTKDEVLGRELATLIVPERLRGRHRAGIERLRRTGTGRVLGRRLELPALHRDGHELQVELTLSMAGPSPPRSCTTSPSASAPPPSASCSRPSSRARATQSSPASPAGPSRPGTPAPSGCTASAPPRRSAAASPPCSSPAPARAP